MPRTIQDEIKQRRPFGSPAQEATIALLRTASDVAHGLEVALAPEGVTRTQFNVLRILRGADTPLPTMEVAERMVDHTPGITRLIDRLEARGLVERVRCGQDRRRTLCTITDAGRVLLDRVDPLVAGFGTRAMERLDAEASETFVRLLAEVREGVRAA